MGSSARSRGAPQRPQSALGTPEKRSPAGSKQGSSGRGAEKAEAAERPQSAAARLAPERVPRVRCSRISQVATKFRMQDLQASRWKFS